MTFNPIAIVFFCSPFFMAANDHGYVRQDHDNAAALASGLAALPGVRTKKRSPSHTNAVYFEVRASTCVYINTSVNSFAVDGRCQGVSVGFRKIVNHDSARASNFLRVEGLYNSFGNSFQQGCRVSGQLNVALSCFVMERPVMRRHTTRVIGLNIYIYNIYIYIYNIIYIFALVGKYTHYCYRSTV